MLYKTSISIGILINHFIFPSFEPNIILLMHQPPFRQRRKGVVTSTHNGIRAPVLQTQPIILANSYFRQQHKSQNQRSHQGTPQTGDFGMFGVVPTEIDKQVLGRTGRT